MRSTIVPAQVTTVEDKIAGNITVQQALILGFPLLIAFASTMLLPPFGSFSGYKVVVTAAFFLVCGALALRIKDRIVVQWLILFAKYCARPQYFVYDKNTTYLRSLDPEPVIQAANKKASTVRRQKMVHPQIPHKDYARLEQLARDQRAGLSFNVGKKGELNVRITEVQ